MAIAYSLTFSLKIWMILAAYYRIISLISDTGMIPAQRNTEYEILLTFYIEEVQHVSFLYVIFTKSISPLYVVFTRIIYT